MHSTHEAPAQRGPRRASVLRIAVYAAAVVLLVAAAFFARGFSRDVGDGSVAGRFSLFPVLGSRVPEELTLTWNGLALRFTRSMTPALTGIETTAGSTDLLFEGDVRLRLTPGTDAGGSITLSPVGAAASAVPAALVVPYSVAGVVQDPPAGSGLSWKRAGRTFLFTLPRGARSDPDGRHRHPAPVGCRVDRRPSRRRGGRRGPRRTACCLGAEQASRRDGNAGRRKASIGPGRLRRCGVQRMEPDTVRRGLVPVVARRREQRGFRGPRHWPAGGIRFTGNVAEDVRTLVERARPARQGVSLRCPRRGNERLRGRRP